MKHFLFSFMLLGSLSTSNIYANDEVKILKEQIAAYEAMAGGKNAEAHQELAENFRKKSRWSVRRNVKTLDLESKRITSKLFIAKVDAEAKLKKIQSTIAKNGQQIDIDNYRIKKLEADENFTNAYKKRGTTIKILEEMTDADYDHLAKHGLDIKGKSARAQMAAVSSHDGYAKLRDAAKDSALRGKQMKFKSLYGYLGKNEDLLSMLGDKNSVYAQKLKNLISAKESVKKMQAGLDAAKSAIEVADLKVKLAKAKLNAAKLGHALKINMELADVPKMPKKTKGFMGRHGGKLITCGGLAAGGVTLYHFNDDVNRIYNKHFRPVVKEVGEKTEEFGKDIQKASEKELDIQKSDFDDLLLTPKSLKAGIEGFDVEEYKKTLKKNGDKLLEKADKGLDEASKHFNDYDEYLKKYWSEKAQEAKEDIVDAADCAAVTAKRRIVEGLGGVIPEQKVEKEAGSGSKSN